MGGFQAYRARAATVLCGLRRQLHQWLSQHTFLGEVLPDLSSEEALRRTTDFHCRTKKPLFQIPPFALAFALQSTAAANPAEGRVLFDKHCAVCHGAYGNGGGIAATGLKTNPADLTKIASRRDGVWPMLEVMSSVDGHTKRIPPREEVPVFAVLI